MDRSIKVKCKRCGKTASSDSFVLDGDYRMMVCPFCIQEKKDKQKHQAASIDKMRKQAEEQEKIKSKPAGWDEEDEYLNRLHKQKAKVGGDFEAIDEDRIKYTCSKCKYKFVHYLSKKAPSACPYCGMQVILK